jgi:hypothetical protein
VLGLQCSAQLPETASLDEETDAIIRPDIEFGLGHRLAEAESAALRQRGHHAQKLRRGELGAVDGKTAGAVTIAAAPTSVAAPSAATPKKTPSCPRQ